jgi:hypothetical protein
LCIRVSDIILVVDRPVRLGFGCPAVDLGHESANLRKSRALYRAKE